MREYEAEDLELRRATASGLWNKKMSPDARMDTEEKAEIKKLTDALKGQVHYNAVVVVVVVVVVSCILKIVPIFRGEILRS